MDAAPTPLLLPAPRPELSEEPASEESSEVVLCDTDEAFCAYVASGSTVMKAYEMAYGYRPTRAETQEIVRRPEVMARLRRITEAFNCSIGITKMSHLDMMAEIRDRAMDLCEMQVAFNAEKARGQVAGYYDKEVMRSPVTPATPGGGSLTVSVSFAAPPQRNEEGDIIDVE